MAVYEGVLRKISGGKVIVSREDRGARLDLDSGLPVRIKGPRDDQGGWTQRQFVDIGETRIKNVVLTPYHDALLQEAVGQEVALSMTGPKPDSSKRHTVVAIRTPKGGVERPSRKQLWAAATWHTLRGWVAAIFGALFLFVALAAVTWILYAIFLPWDLFVVLVFVEAAIALAFFVWLVVSPVRQSMKMFRAAAALDGTPTSSMLSTS